MKWGTTERSRRIWLIVSCLNTVLPNIQSNHYNGNLKASPKLPFSCEKMICKT